MKFQLLSDIHLEYYNETPDIPVKAENLILAGDVGYPNTDTYVNFMEEMVNKFDRVFYVPGNHEYYAKDFNKGCRRLINRYSCRKNRIYKPKHENILYSIDDVTLIGSTLWTECNVKNWKILELFMNDYNKIYKAPGINITSWDTGRWHYDSLNFLKEEINKTGRKVVITHHLPSIEFIHPKYKGNPGNCGFYSNLDYLFNDSIEVWCAGHTHEKIDKTIGQSRIYVNPVGYPRESKNINWEFVFEI